MGAASLIARKDLKLRIRDRSAFIVGVLAPLGLAFIFNLVLGNVAEGDFVPVIAIADLDGGAVSEGFVAVLDQIDADGVIDVAERPTNAAAKLVRSPRTALLPQRSSSRRGSVRPY